MQRYLSSLILTVFFCLFAPGCELPGDEDNFYDSTRENLNLPVAEAVFIDQIAAFVTLDPAQEKKVLDFVNHKSTTMTILDIDVGLTSTAAKNIVAHRDGADGIYGTSDDDLFDTVQELDDVPYVGPTALDAIIAYAANWTPPEENPDDPDAYLFKFLNHETTTYEVLKNNVGLTTTQATNVIAHRNGPDGIYGTSDDNPFDSIKELDDVSGIGQATIDKLKAYAAKWTPPNPDNQYAKLFEFLNHKTTTAALLDDYAGLTATQAANIISHRNGPDGVYGTADDNPFDSIAELDAVSGIDAAAIETLKAYAATWQPPQEDPYEKVFKFLNHESTTVDVLKTKVGLTSTQATNIIAHRNGPDGILGTSDDNLFDSIEEIDSVPYIGLATIDKIKAYAATWQPPTNPDEHVTDPEVPLKEKFAGDKSEYDLGPAKGSGWAQLFAQVPNYRVVSRELGKLWLVPDPVTGKSKFQTANEELVAAGKDPIQEYTLTEDKFRYTMGPLFYRGRLDGTARVLVMGQEGATDEALVHRGFVGGTGQKVQNFLNSIGITKSYVCMNTFVYSIFEQYDAFTAELAETGPIKNHRNQLIEKVYQESDLRLILTFGNAAKRSIEIWRDELHGGKLPSGVKWAHMLHPGMAAMAYDFTVSEVSPTDPSIIAAVVNSFTYAWKKIWYWKYLDPNWLPSDPDGWKFQGKKFYYMDMSIPYRDLPYGVSKFLGRLGTASERSSSGLQVQFHSPNGVRYEAPNVPFPSATSKALSGYLASAGELPWESPKVDPDNRHDPGPGAAWSEYFLQTPSQADVEAEAGVVFANDFADPVWYRGKINGKPWLLIIAQNWSIDSFIAGRTCSGEEGQKTAHFLNNIGAGLNYVVISPYPYLLDKNLADDRMAFDLAMSNKLSVFRNQLFEKILQQTDIKLVLTFGDIAEEAFIPMLGKYKGKILNLAHPKDSGAYMDWNLALQALKGWKTELGLTGAFTSYTSAGFTNARSQIPREDMPFGSTLWMGTSGDISQLADPSWLFWNAPKWIKYVSYQ